MTDAPKKRRGRPAKKKKEEVKEAPAFLEEKPKQKREVRPSVEMLKNPCIHCGLTKLVTIKTDEPLEVCHRAKGATYNTLVRRLAKCKNCNKHNSINCFEIR
jgi:hypothetical protein